MVKIINEVDFSGFDNNNGLGFDWVVSIPKECIKGATLLSLKEYEKYKNNIPIIDDFWWLRTPGLSPARACFVDNCGDTDDYFSVHDIGNGVRPALILNLQHSNLNIEDKFEFGEHLFTIISNDLAICNDFIDVNCFREDFKDPDANIYEKSDVKKIVDNWFNKAYREYEE